MRQMENDKALCKRHRPRNLPPKSDPKKRQCVYVTLMFFITKERTEKKVKVFWGQVYGASLLVTPDDAMPDTGVFLAPLSP